TQHLTVYKKKLSVVRQSQSGLKKAKEEKEALAKEADYNTFLLNELIEANLKEGEQAELEAELEKLSNVEFLKESLSKVLTLANEEQMGALQNLKEIKNALQKISGISKQYNDFHERISSLLIEFDDINNEVSQDAEKLADDPQQLELVNQKLQLIYSLQKK